MEKRSGKKACASMLYASVIASVRVGKRTNLCLYLSLCQNASRADEAWIEEEVVQMYHITK